MLTPSRLTGGLYELFPYGGWKAPVGEPAPLRTLVIEPHGHPHPVAPKRLAAIIEWYVRAAARRARRPAARHSHGVARRRGAAQIQEQ